MPRATLLSQRLLVLFLAGLLLLFSPVVSRFADLGHWRGVPAFLVYLFGAWAGIIVIAAWILSRTRD